MPNTNGHGLKRAVLWAILYARVSTDEQARSGYSLAQQLEALREYAAREGYEVLEEVVDPGQSGASLERPGMDRVRDLVAEGGVAVVLAQDRDRFAREPAYHYLLRREFEEHGTKLRALNDRGDDSPEGQLTDGILDQLAKFERAKITERTRRGKLQKARSGKVVGGHTANYGFRMNAARDGYAVDEPKMAVVRRIFRMIGEEGLAITAVTKILNKEGEPGPTGGRWNTKAVRWFVLDDVYKPHTSEEVAKLVSPEVAALLDRDRRYGIWWFNRERWRRTKISEPSLTGEGRDYRWKVVSTLRPREEWVAVPVPDSGIPRETVEAARHIVGNNVACSSNGDRFWELSGGVLRCSECGRRMRTSVTRKKDGKRYFYYSCASRREGKLSSCANRKTHRAERIEPAVWDLVSELLTDPERLRAGLDAMVEQERSGSRGNPDHEARVWLERLAEADRMRAGYQELAAKGLMTFEELGARLEELETTRRTASDELEAIRRRAERLEGLEHDRDALMEFYAGALPEELERLKPEERRRVYEMLRLEVSARPDGTLEVHGILGESLRVGSENGRAVCAPELAPSPRRARS
jgi:site-specific DNA recombinase